MFLDYDGDYCYVQNGTVFPAGEVLGQWNLVDSCGGCTGIHYSLEEDTSSTSSDAGTSSWSNALGEKVSAGIKFLGNILAPKISGAVSNLMQPAYSYTVTEKHTCEASCGNGTEANWYLYQWVVNAQEYYKADTSPFNINACQYQCNTEEAPPKCPPGYCADFSCQTCTSTN